MREIYAKYLDREGPWEGRQRFIRDFLFFGCLTGERLKTAFAPVFDPLWGEDGWYWRFTWEETSIEFGGNSGAVFPPDPDHVALALGHYRPAILVCFGRVAESALGYSQVEMAVKQNNTRILYAPHPAARGSMTLTRLREVATKIKNHITEQ
jgi:hypothetical protein